MTGPTRTLRQDLPCETTSAAEAIAGLRRAVIPLGFDTVLFIGSAERLVLERPEPPVTAAAVAAVVRAARSAGLRTPAVDVIPGGWLARPYIDGWTPLPTSPSWDELRSATLRLLSTLAAAPVPDQPPLPDVPEVWHRRVATDEPVLAERLRKLGTAVDPTPRLVHGDVAPQNLVLGEGGAVLLDWEGAGTGRSGFDAGWVLALNAIGRGLRMEHDELRRRLLDLGEDEAALRWGEALGLARMLWRSHRLAGAAVWRGTVEGLLVKRLGAWRS